MNQRQSYIDNIRVYLTILVILHHTAITYGAPGGWYYREEVNNDVISGLILTIFVATNQAFFMGLFFFLSSYFIPASYDRKGPRQFIADRLKRLGIPIVFYILVLAPVTVFMLVKLHYNSPVTIIEYYLNRDEWISVGVLWFTTALLLFTGIYWLIRSLGESQKHAAIKLPGNLQILLFALGLGIISFAVRILFPIGWTLRPVGFQFAHFTQYIAFFIVGIVAYRNNWLAGLTREHSKFWWRIAIVLIVIGFPGIYSIKIITNSELDAFMGGVTIQSLLNAIWEQMLGISLSMALLSYGKFKWNGQGTFMKELSRDAYAVYIIHPLIVVTISLLVKDVQLHSLIKFPMVGTLSIISSFSVGAILTRLPIIRDVV